MSVRLSGFVFAATLLGGSATAQDLPPGYLDPGPILRAASEAIGVANLRCVAISGSAYAGMVGQQRLNGYDVDWPRGRPLTNYTRTMNWETGTMVEEFDREPGNNPASWKHGLGWLGGTPIQLAAGYAHTCAILEDGTLRCWGSRLSGMLGYGLGACTDLELNCANDCCIGDNEHPEIRGPVPVF